MKRQLDFLLEDDCWVLGLPLIGRVSSFRVKVIRKVVGMSQMQRWKNPSI
jgi:hypothetical protein